MYRKILALLLIGTVGAALQAAAGTIQADDFEGHAVGATLDNGSGDDITGWSRTDLSASTGDDNQAGNVTIIDSTPGDFTTGQQMDIDPSGANFVFVGTDNTVAAADVKTLVLEVDAQLFAGSSGSTGTGSFNLTFGPDPDTRYSFIINADDGDTSFSEVTLNEGGTTLDTASPASFSPFDLHTYEFRYTPDAGSAHLQGFIDGTKDGPASLRLIVCGSDLSIMAKLLEGAQALRGRASVDTVMRGGMT